jgi:hypothetical protein
VHLYSIFRTFALAKKTIKKAFKSMEIFGVLKNEYHGVSIES